MSDRDSIHKRIAEWQEQLLDLSKRNRLINCRVGKSAALELQQPALSEIWRQIVTNSSQMTFARLGELEIQADESITPDTAINDSTDQTIEKPIKSEPELWPKTEPTHLAADQILTDLPDKKLEGKLMRLSLAAKTSLSEQGVNTLFIAFGLLRWFESKDSNIPLLAPLLLIPASLTRDSADSEWQISALEDELVPNYCLNELLRSNFQLDAPDFDERVLTDTSDALPRLLQTYNELIADHPRWKVEDRCVLGIFGFQKIAMWQDICRNKRRISEHSLCRAIGGDTEAIRNEETRIDETTLDSISRSSTTHHIRDCDASQFAAIEAVKSGANLVLHGPPGTGKSQTIANVIAEFLAHGKTVLFVSEKAAALEVVKRRLDEADLSDFCLELHSHKANKKDTISRLSQSLQLPPEQHSSQEDTLSELDLLRKELNSYVEALHEKRFSLNRSAFQIHGRLTSLSDAPASRCSIQNVGDIDSSRLAELIRSIKAVAQLSDVLETRDTHPWRGFRNKDWSLTLADDIRHHFPQLANLLADKLACFERLTNLGFTLFKPTLKGLDEAMATAVQASELPSIPESWFRTDARQVALGYQELFKLSQEFATRRKKVGQYHSKAIDFDATELIDRVQKNSEWLERVMPHPCTGVRSVLQHLRTVADELRQISELARQMETVVERANRLLSREASNSAIAGLQQLAAVTELISRLGNIQPSWFNAAIRSQLIAQSQAWMQDSENLLGERNRITLIFNENAFSSNISETLKEVRSRPSFFHRLLPKWKRTKLEFLSLYREPCHKSTNQLAADASRLIKYRLQFDGFLDAIKPYAEAIGWDKDLNFDWSQFRTDLGLIEQAEFLLPATTKLITMLSISGGVDRVQMSETADILKKQVQQFEQTLTRLEEVYDIRSSQYRSLTLEEFRAWVDDAISALASRCADLEILSSLIVEDRDSELSGIHKDAKALQALREIQKKARSHAISIEQKEDIDLEMATDRWQAQAVLGKQLLTIFSDSKWPLPAVLIRIMTDESTRKKLAEAIDSIDAKSTPSLLESLEFTRHIFDFDKDVSFGVVLGELSITELISWLNDRANDVHKLQRYLQLTESCRIMCERGLQQLLDEMVTGTVSPLHADRAFLKRFYTRWLDEVYSEAAALRKFQIEDHETTIANFRQIDKEIIQRSYERIRCNQLNQSGKWRSMGWDAPASSERGVLMSEANKKRRHMPLRLLFRRIPTLLLKLKPCLMMSPLAVSTYLDSDRIQFDLVIFDEASQVRPHDAIGAVYRGKQLLVAGDENQLPPSIFFERHASANDNDNDEENDEAWGSTTDFESILQVCKSTGFRNMQLKWHYRSRRETLIAFSNLHFYQDGLVTFPSAADVEGSSGVKLQYVAEGRWHGGSGAGTNPVEARHTADLVVKYIKQYPERSIGVITMNQAQQILVLNEIEQRKRSNPALAEFFREDRTEPFFVKNLENVQGDERDIILFAINYARNPAGTLSHNFGPLNRDGGERRLNVAVTRARWEITVVSSIRADDIDLSRTQARGAQLLRAYLDYAERGTRAIQANLKDTGQSDFESEFEAEVAKALQQQGLNVRSQVGCSGFKIDLALVDPSQPGRYVLGIECDGATYHSSATARDRDRLRQDILEDLGWTICRVWSTDWVRDHRKQLSRILVAYENAKVAPRNPSSEPPTHTPARAIRSTPPSANAPRRVEPIPLFSSIDQVTSETIDDAVKQLLNENGSTPEADLIKAVARRLGFNRTGSKISNRIEQRLRQLLRKNRIQLDEDGLLFDMPDPSDQR